MHFQLHPGAINYTARSERFTRKTVLNAGQAFHIPIVQVVSVQLHLVLSKHRESSNGDVPGSRVEQSSGTDDDSRKQSRTRLRSLREATRTDCYAFTWRLYYPPIRVLSPATGINVNFPPTTVTRRVIARSAGSCSAFRLAACSYHIFREEGIYDRHKWQNALVCAN